MTKLCRSSTNDVSTTAMRHDPSISQWRVSCFLSNKDDIPLYCRPASRNHLKEGAIEQAAIEKMAKKLKVALDVVNSAS